MSASFTAFSNHRRVAGGSLERVARAVKAFADATPEARVLVFADGSGAELDIDLRGTAGEVVARLADHPVYGAAKPRPGRPKLGVVSREVSLLPRHWAWLKTRSRSASATLRRLVEAEMKATAGDEAAREARDAAHRFMWALAGDLPGYEEALRVLYGDAPEGLAQIIAAWPADVRDYALALARGEGTEHAG